MSPGLTDRAAGAVDAQQSWEEALLAQVERLRRDVLARDLETCAAAVAAERTTGGLTLDYWGQPVFVAWPELTASWRDGGKPCSPFDTAMILYHLRASDGTPPSGGWIAFRELPDGSFYHQAYSGYTGRRLAAGFGTSPESFDLAAQELGGERIVGLAPSAWKFTPLPRIPLCACLYPGDEELPPQASVLFDANAGRHLPTDGLALLGAGLTGRLLRAVAVSA